MLAFFFLCNNLPKFPCQNFVPLEGSHKVPPADDFVFTCSTVRGFQQTVVGSKKD